MDKEYLLGLNLAEISLGFLLTVTSFAHKIYEPVMPLEQKVNYALLSSQNLQVCELREEVKEFPTALAKTAGYGLIVHGAYGIGKRKREL